MKIYKFIVIIVALILVSSCGQKKVVLIAPTFDARILFEKADKLFKTKKYDKALVLYTKYYQEFSDSSLAPAALLKIGTIYSSKKEYIKAREVFKKIVDSYNGDMMVVDAMLSILLSYYNENDFYNVIEYGRKMPDDITQDNYLARKYSIIGDAHISLNSFKDGFKSYNKVYKFTSGPTKKNYYIKLKEIVEKLEKDDVLELIMAVEDKEELPRGDLLYRLSLIFAMEDSIEDTISTLKRFIELYPQHDQISDAEDLLKNFEEKLNLWSEEEIINPYNPLLVGCLLPQGRHFEYIGSEIERGVLMALSKFGAKDDMPAIDIIFKNTKSSTEETIKAVREFAKKGVSAIIGPIYTHTAKAAAKEAQKQGIPIITLSWSSDIVDEGSFVFRNSMTPQMQVKNLVDYVINEKGIKNFAVLFPDNSYGNEFSSLFWDEVLKNGGFIRAFEPYDHKSTDFSDAIKKLVGLYHEMPKEIKNWKIKFIEEQNEEFEKQKQEKDNDQNDLLSENDDKGEIDVDDENKDVSLEDDEVEEEDSEEDETLEDEKPKAIVDFEAIFIPDSPKRVGLILPQLNFFKVTGITLIGNNLWHSDLLMKMARREAQNAILCDGFFLKSKRKIVRNFVNDFKETFGKKSKYISALTYDTTMIVLKTISNSDITTHKQLKEKLHKLYEFNGVTGKTSFDKYGEVHKKLNTIQIKGWQFIDAD